MAVIKNFILSIKDYGLSYTLQRSIHFLERKFDPIIDSMFDYRYGIDTCGIISAENLDISARQKQSAFRYEPTPVRVLRCLLRRLPINHKQYAFIDLGSGKARVLLLASKYPYKSICGVEFSKQLHNIASNNINIWHKYHYSNSCMNLKVICEDASLYSLPLDPLVIFLFTPFKPDVNQKVLNIIKDSVLDVPRPIYILYYGSNIDFITQLRKLKYKRSEIYSHQEYKGLLFSSNI